MAMIDYVSDWSSRLSSRLYTQFRGKVTWGQWVGLLSGLAQDWEDAAQTLLTILDIGASVGVQLDTIGRLIGQPRFGVSDPTYRLYLYARVLANRSTGTAEEIYAVLATLLGGAATQYIPGFVKQFAIRVLTPITRVQSFAAGYFLAIAKESGARAILEWQEQADAATFYTGLTAITSVNALAGQFFMSVYCAAGMPTSGSAILDYGLSTQETLTYTISSTDFFTWTAAMSFNHPVGSSVEYVGDTGLGFGSATDATLGGALAGAEEA